MILGIWVYRWIVTLQNKFDGNCDGAMWAGCDDNWPWFWVLACVASLVASITIPAAFFCFLPLFQATRRPEFAEFHDPIDDCKQRIWQLKNCNLFMAEKNLDLHERELKMLERGPLIPSDWVYESLFPDAGWQPTTAVRQLAPGEDNNCGFQNVLQLYVERVKFADTYDRKVKLFKGMMHHVMDHTELDSVTSEEAAAVPASCFVPGTAAGGTGLGDTWLNEVSTIHNMDFKDIVSTHGTKGPVIISRHRCSFESKGLDAAIREGFGTVLLIWQVDRLSPEPQPDDSEVDISYKIRCIPLQDQRTKWLKELKIPSLKEQNNSILGDIKTLEDELFVFIKEDRKEKQAEKDILRQHDDSFVRRTKSDMAEVVAAPFQEIYAARLGHAQRCKLIGADLVLAFNQKHIRDEKAVQILRWRRNTNNGKGTKEYQKKMKECQVFLSAHETVRSSAETAAPVSSNICRMRTV